MWSDVLTKPLQGRAYCKMRSNLMNYPIDYDDDAGRRATHPDLLPEEGWSTEPKELARNSEVLLKAVQLMSLIRQGRTSLKHRRSVLEEVQRAGRTVRSARPDAHQAGRPASSQKSGPLQHVTARTSGGGKPAGGRRRSREVARRNKYVPALLFLHRLAQHVRAS